MLIIIGTVPRVLLGMPVHVPRLTLQPKYWRVHNQTDKPTKVMAI